MSINRLSSTSITTVLISEEHKEKEVNTLSIEDPEGKTQKRRLDSYGWYFVFFIVLPTWPFLRIYYSGILNLSFYLAILCLFTLTGIFIGVFPISVCIFFLVIYIAMVLVEFILFLQQPADPLSPTIRKTFSYWDEMTSLQRHLIIKPSWPSWFRRLFGWLSRYFYPLLLLSIPMQLILAICVGDTATVVPIETCLEDFILLKGMEYSIFQLTIMLDAKEINKEMLVFYSSYSVEAIYPTTLLIKKLTDKWRSSIANFVIIDIGQNISILIMIFIIIASQFVDVPFFTDWLKNEKSLILQYEAQIGTYKSKLWLYLAYGIYSFFVKLTFTYQINSFDRKMKTSFKSIVNQLSYIILVPQSFLQLNRDGKKYTPTPNELIKWEDICFNENAYEDLFETKKDIIRPLLKSIQREEETSELTYRQLNENISRHVQLSLDRFNLIRSRYEEFFSVVEYKIFGLLTVNKQLLVSVSIAAVTAGFGYLVTYGRSHLMQ